MRTVHVIVCTIVVLSCIGLRASQRSRAVPSTTTPSYYPLNLDGIVTLAGDSDNSVWVVADLINPGLIGNLTAHNEFRTSQIPITPFFVARDGDGDLWFAGTTTFVRVRGGQITQYGPTTATISGLTIDGLGRAWFTEANANMVGFVDPISNQISEIRLPTDLPQPKVIASGPDGRIWFAASNGHLGAIDSNLGISAMSFPALDDKPIPAMLSMPDAIYVAVNCRACNRIECRFPKDHGLIVRITADQVSTVIADIGRRNFYTLAGTRNQSIYALTELFAIAPGPPSWPGPFLIVRPDGTTTELPIGIPPTIPVTRGTLIATPDGSIWGSYLGGLPMVFRFAPWQLR